MCHVPQQDTFIFRNRQNSITEVPRSTQPSTLHQMVKWVSDFQPTNNKCQRWQATYGWTTSPTSLDLSHVQQLLHAAQVPIMTSNIRMDYQSHVIGLVSCSTAASCCSSADDDKLHTDGLPVPHIVSQPTVVDTTDNYSWAQWSDCHSLWQISSTMWTLHTSWPPHVSKIHLQFSCITYQ